MTTKESINFEQFKKSRTLMTPQQYEDIYQHNVNEGYTEEEESFAIALLVYEGGFYININIKGEVYVMIDRSEFYVGKGGITLEFLEAEMYNYCIVELGYQGLNVSLFTLCYKEEHSTKTKEFYFTSYQELINHITKPKNIHLLSGLTNIIKKEVQL